MRNSIRAYAHTINENLVPPNVAGILNADGLLPISALGAPVRVTFPVWTDIRVGDSYQLLWDGQPIGAIKFIEPNDRPGDILMLEIPVNVLVEGKHQLSYLLTEAENHSTAESPSTPVEVDRTAPGNPLLAPIIFPPLALDGLTGIELEGLGNVLRGSIASYQGMAQFDRIQTYWNGVPGPAVVVTADDMGLKQVTVEFSRAFLEAIGDIEAPVFYTVTDLAGNQSMRSADIRVKLQLATVAPDLVFDTTPATLAGKIYLIPGYPDVLPAFADGTTLQRIASGGQPPYTYRSSNTLVAVVDGNGLASVRGNGTATISVTDSLGASASYALTVTGVIHCLALGKGKFGQVATAAAGQGGRLPSIQELKEIAAAYGNRWPMGNSHYWSSTMSHQVIIRWYFLKNLVTGAEYKLSEHGASLGVALR